MIVRRRGGPSPYVRLDLVVKVDQGAEAHRLHSAGFTFAEIADQLGVSVTTAWRRCRWFEDWTRPAESGLPIRRIPPQRGTRACPRGRPCIPEVDHPELSSLAPVRCLATRRDGCGCGNPPMRGQAVCRMHGGASPQARRAAAPRMEAARQRRVIGYQLHQHC
ncbi:MAG: hypothetical protein ACRDTH_21295 [Pseudonocardiaceae bacterium]